MSLVDRIQKKCQEKGTSIKALERAVGFGNGTIKRWDTNIPSYDKVIKVAEFLQISFCWLILGKESENLTPEEQQLISLFRKADNRGKRNILRTAEAECTELESSISQTG